MPTPSCQPIGLDAHLNPVAALPATKVADGATKPWSRRAELALFCFLAFVLVPVASIAIVGGYGFLVWMYQIWAGPPGPGL